MDGGFFRFLGGAGRGCCAEGAVVFGFLAVDGPADDPELCFVVCGALWMGTEPGIVLAEVPSMLSLALLLDVRPG
jgi:hypothetical protein